MSPHWTCESCGARLYSASESLRWGDCPVCSGALVKRREGAGTDPADSASGEEPRQQPSRDPGGRESQTGSSTSG